MNTQRKTLSTAIAFALGFGAVTTPAHAQEQAAGSKSEKAYAEAQQAGQQARQKQKARSFAEASNWLGMEVTDRDGQEVGSLEDFAIDAHSGRIAYATIEIESDLFEGDDGYLAVPLAMLEANQRGALRLGVGTSQWRNAESFDEDQWPTEPTLAFRDSAMGQKQMGQKEQLKTARQERRHDTKQKQSEREAQQLTGRELFKRMDENDDGRVSRKEFASYEPDGFELKGDRLTFNEINQGEEGYLTRQQLVDRLDENDDGIIWASELHRFVAEEGGASQPAQVDRQARRDNQQGNRSRSERQMAVLDQGEQRAERGKQHAGRSSQKAAQGSSDSARSESRSETAARASRKSGESHRPGAHRASDGDSAEGDLQTRFVALDSNVDGQISESELMDAMDRNGDGKISREEFVSLQIAGTYDAEPLWFSRIKDEDSRYLAQDNLIDALDQNGDGRIERKELRRFRVGQEQARADSGNRKGDLSRARGQQSMDGSRQSSFQSLDGDGDGYLTRSEVVEAMDRDDDGAIGRGEFTSFELPGLSPDGHEVVHYRNVRKDDGTVSSSKLWEALDDNSDGRLSRSEFAAFEKKQESERAKSDADDEMASLSSR